jgi:hypothetical protein
MSSTSNEEAPRRVSRVACLAAVAAVALAAGGAVARADTAPSCFSPASQAYALDMRALTGPQGAEVRLAFTPAQGCTGVEVLKNLQLKTFSADGSKEDNQNLKAVPAPGGVATVDLGRVERGWKVAAHVLVQTGTPERTYVVRGETTTQLRPDLVVAAVHAPAQTLTTRPVDVTAEIAEANGDTGADATVTLMWGPTPLGSTNVTVPAGGRVSVAFTGVALTTPAPTELSVVVSAATPAEADTANNTKAATVDVSELELQRSRLVLGSLGGYGAQFNQHVYASVTPAPPGSLPDLEAKAKALEPQLVRIFYNENLDEPGNATYLPENRESFFRTVELAQEAGATINITYHVYADARFAPVPHMQRFAAALEEAVRTRHLTNVRWVTVANEPNGALITLAQYEALSRALHAELVARGLREHIRMMAGDLVESSGAAGSDHRNWFSYIATHMNDITDAYSVHIYWNYWDIPRMEFRLRDVRDVVFDELPVEARKPVYVTEFGVRGLRPGDPPIPQPGNWEDGTPLQRTNLAAFQQLWFSVAATQLGFSGTVKWDAYWGKYNSTYNASHWLIGPAEEGWPLMPAYHALRLLLQTTQRGWQVVGVDPWADDDWKTDVDDQAEKEVAAYAGPNGELTLVGLDSRARALNAASTESVAYSVGGLPPGTMFNLGIWNAAADGTNTLGGRVVANAAGVARFEIPLQAAFALTTVPMS